MACWKYPSLSLADITLLRLVTKCFGCLYELSGCYYKGDGAYCHRMCLGQPCL
ncbi:hypothetical protein Ptr902_10655 [Pyrenophora tritici-repentis]|uniref:Uncharacterized protein n=1 Tax=Pyrenophora tritici-repentis TaxID=45151 RepID=A0A834RMS9_9PLEO|nr:hypothetical protein PtrM4_135660 [Pyrenophora tritici-repentis]KAI2477972.1 hypothetical protein Ptr902_10655 [Pyrenophora tritici-repentis]